MRSSSKWMGRKKWMGRNGDDERRKDEDMDRLMDEVKGNV